LSYSREIRILESSGLAAGKLTPNTQTTAHNL
jgi:hypothetical protein